MDAPRAAWRRAAEDLGERVLRALIPESVQWPRIIHGPLAAVIGWVAGRVRRDAVKLTQVVVTEAMMGLSLPGVLLALGRDLMAPVPAALADAPHPLLDAFVREYDPCPPGGTACGANDWCDLRQRMHYIVHLFRSYALEPSLFSRPFTPEQISSFQAGVVPEGEL